MSKSTALVPAGDTPALPATRQENKREKFRRLANGRAVEAIAAIDRLGNLGTSAYEYSDQQVKALETAIADALKRAVGRLRARTAGKVERKEII